MLPINQLYQLEYHLSSRYRYTIKNEDISDRPRYLIHRSRFRKHQLFEDIHKKKLFYIDETTVKSVNHERTLAVIKMEKKTIETMIGDFILTDLDIGQRSYILRINDHIVAEVRRHVNEKNHKQVIELKNINTQYRAFIFSLLILIESVLDTLQSPIYHLHKMHRPQLPSDQIHSHSYYRDRCNSEIC